MRAFLKGESLASLGRQWPRLAFPSNPLANPRTGGIKNRCVARPTPIWSALIISGNVSPCTHQWGRQPGQRLPGRVQTVRTKARRVSAGAFLISERQNTMATPLHTTDPRVAYMAQGEFFATFDDARSFLADQDKGRGKVRTDYTVIDSAYESSGRYCVAYAFVTKAGRSLGMIYEAGPIRP